MGPAMNFRLPATFAIVAAASLLLSGCLAYDAASTVVSAGSTVVGAAGSVVGAAGDVVTSPFDHDDSDKARNR
jgi:hypothetical protein